MEKNRRADVKVIERFLKKQGAKPVTGAKKNAPEYKKLILDAKQTSKKSNRS